MNDNLSTGAKFSAAARELDAQAKQIDAKRNRPPATAEEVKAHQQLTPQNRFAAAFAGRDPDALLSRQSGGAVEQLEITPTPQQTTAAKFRDAFARRPEPPAPQPELAPAPVAAGDDRKRLPEAAASLFDALEQRLQAPPAATAAPSPDAALRQALQGLPDADRARVEAMVQRENYHDGYYDQRQFSPSFRSILTADALAQRLADARRLDPSITPDVLVARMVQAGQGE